MVNSVHYIFVTLCFLALSSFCGVVVNRTVHNQNVLGRSHCGKCGTKLLNRDNIPILGYLMLWGRCRNCKCKISIFYPISEILLTSILLLVINQSISFIEAVLWVAFTCFGFCLSAIDAKIHRLPNWLTLSSFISLLPLTFMKSFRPESPSFINGIFGACGALIFFLLLNIVSDGGMGMGDVKYSASIGLLTGSYSYYFSLRSFFLSFMLASIFGLCLILLKKAERKSYLPFGPFLFISPIILFLFGFQW